MKVRCVDCKKRFDYELYSGVCPKCGNYMRPTEIETSENANCDKEGSHVHVEKRTESYKTKTPEIQSTHVEPVKKKKTNPVITIVLIVAMTVTGVTTAVYVRASQAKIHEENIVKAELPVKSQKQSDVITYLVPELGNQYDITIDSISIDTDPRFALSENYEAVKLNYHINRTKLNGESSDYENFYEIQMNVYMETKSGYYLSPASNFQISRMWNVEYDQVSELGINDSFEKKQGIIYFFVKKDDVKNLYITVADYDHEKYSAGELREVIRVEELEVAR